MQSTYENFRYRYDRQVNPYNKGVIENFKEIFCSGIPPSKNNFRSKVPIPKEQSETSFRMGIDNMGPMMRKTTSDLEAAENLVGEEEEKYYKDGFTNDNGMSVDLRRMLHTERGHRRPASSLRNSLESSRKWEVTPEVRDEIQEAGESKRNDIDNDSCNEPSGNSTNTASKI